MSSFEHNSESSMPDEVLAVVFVLSDFFAALIIRHREKHFGAHKQKQMEKLVLLNHYIVEYPGARIRLSQFESISSFGSLLHNNKNVFSVHQSVLWANVMLYFLSCCACRKTAVVDEASAICRKLEELINKNTSKSYS